MDGQRGTPRWEVEQRRVLEYTTKLREARAEKWHEGLPAKFKEADRLDDPTLSIPTGHFRSGNPGLASLVVRGGFGTGKTWLAMSYVKVLVRDRLVDPGEVLVGTEADLLASLTQQATWDMGPGLASLTASRWKVVFIDDVGVGVWRSDQTKRGVWHPIVDAMYSENRTLVISTELSLPALSKHLGDSVWSRIQSMCAGSIVQLSSEQRTHRDAPLRTGSAHGS